MTEIKKQKDKITSHLKQNITNVILGIVFGVSTGATIISTLQLNKNEPSLTPKKTEISNNKIKEALAFSISAALLSLSAIILLNWDKTEKKVLTQEQLSQFIEFTIKLIPESMKMGLIAQIEAQKFKRDFVLYLKIIEIIKQDCDSRLQTQDESGTLQPISKLCSEVFLSYLITFIQNSLGNNSETLTLNRSALADKYLSFLNEITPFKLNFNETIVKIKDLSSDVSLQNFELKS